MDHENVAWLMVRWYGADAAPYAALQRDWSLKLANLGGFHDWKRVVNAIEKLQAQLPPKDGAVR